MAKKNLHIDCQFYLLLTLIIVKFAKFMATTKRKKTFQILQEETREEE